MTTELEQEFYDTFGIEPEYYCTYEKVAENKLEYECTDNNLVKCKECKEVGKRYSDITAEKLLEMICILSQSYPLNYEGWSFNTVQELKETILEDCIKTAKRLSLSSVFANKIQQLFKEEA